MQVAPNSQNNTKNSTFPYFTLQLERNNEYLKTITMKIKKNNQVEI